MRLRRGIVATWVGDFATPNIAVRLGCTSIACPASGFSEAPAQPRRPRSPFLEQLP